MEEEGGVRQREKPVERGGTGLYSMVEEKQRLRLVDAGRIRTGWVSR